MVIEECKHTQFESHVIVNILKDTKEYVADMRIRCADCHKDFEFVGLPHGASSKIPTVSIDKREVRLPIAPADPRFDMPRNKCN